MKYRNLRKEGCRRSNTRSSSVWAFMVVALVATILMMGCIDEKSTSKPVGAVNVKLYFIDPPELGRISTLQFEVRPRQNASNATVNILVPDGIEVVEGNTSWYGKIAANETVNFTIRVKPVKSGEFTIIANIVNRLSEQELRFSQTELAGGNSANLFFNLGYVETRTYEERARANASVRTNIQGNKPQANVNVKLNLSNSPKVGEISDLTFTVIPMEDEHDIKILFILPKGIQIVNGNSSWEGDLKAKNIYDFPIKIKPINEGDYTMSGLILNLKSGGAESTVRFLTSTNVSISKPKISWEADARTKIVEFETINGVNVSEIKSKSIGTDSKSIGISSVSGFLNIYGTLETYNGLYNQWEGVYGATVEIYDWDNYSGDDLLGTTIIENTDGSFDTSVSNNDEEGGGQEIYLKFIANNNYVDISPPSNPLDYWIQTSVMPEAGDNSTLVFYIQTNTTDEMSGAWHVLREVYGGVNYETIKNHVGKVTVEWPYSATEYSPLLNEIHLLLGDRWDDEVILHEYGHFVMDQIYGYSPDSPNCEAHPFNGATSEGCAWTEGWADFFQGAVRNNASYNDDDINPGAHFDLESSWSPSGEDVEGNVAKSLWDMFDNQQINDNFNDDFQTPFSNIFNSFKDPETSYNGSGNGGNVDVIREFWTNWFQYYNYLMQMNRIFYYNGINYDRNPYQPAFLTQYKSDGITGISFGGFTGENTMVMKGNISDPDEDDVRLEVEIQPVGVPFSNITTCLSGPAVASGSNASANCSGLVDGQYHWQARANDSYGATGSWLSAGGNPESSPDVIIDTTLSNWQYNRKLTITGTTAGAQTNYQMKLTVYKASGTDTPGVVYLGGNVKDDFSDLRFTKSDGVTLLDYWIESYNSGVSAVVWVEVDSIPANPGTANIYLYYGNPSSSGASSGAATFVFFDDFEGYSNGDLNGQGGWSGAASFDVQTSVTYKGIKAIIGNPAANGHISKSFTPNLQNAKIVWAESENNLLRFGALRVLENTAQIAFAGLDDFKFRDNAGYFGSASASTWYVFELVIRNNNTHDIKVGASNLQGRSNSASMVSGINKIDLWVSTVSELNYFDYIRVQKYAEPEPAWI